MNKKREEIHKNKTVSRKTTGMDKRTQEILRRSEEKYRTILENIEDGYFEVDLTGKFTFINDTVSRVMGYTKDELIGMDNRQYTAKEDLKEVFQAYNRVYTTGDPIKEFCWQITSKDGSKKYIAGSISLIKNSSGKPTGFRGIVRDTTERRQNEELLRESEKRYRLLADNITEHIWIMDLYSMQTIYISPSVEKMYGFTIDELKRFSLRDILTEESFRRMVEVFFIEMPKALATPPPAIHKYSLELEARHRDGHTVWIENTMSFIPDENGKPVSLLGETRDITERKKAEALLKKSEEQYRLLADHMKDQVWLMDLNLNITYVSPSVERLTGYTFDEIKKLPKDKLLTPESLKKALEFTSLKMPKAMKASSKDFEFRTLELEFILKGGQTVWGECSFSFIRDNQGKVVSILGESRDITDRKLAEEKLHKEEQRFRALAEQSSDIIIMVNREGIIIYENPAVERILGIKSKNRIGNANLFENVHPDDLNIVKSAFRSLFEDKNAGSRRSEVRLRHIDGNWRTFEAVVSNLARENVVEAIIINLRDITERKQAEEALRENENKYRLSFENISDVVFTIDTGLNISSVSPSVERILGYKPQDFIGRSVSDLGKIILTPESFQQAVTNLNHILKGKSISSVIYDFIARDGTIKICELSGSPVMQKGKIIGMISVARDITDHKRAEEALKQSESWYRTIFENTGTAILTIEEDTTISLINTEFEKLSGYSKKEIEGRKHWEEFVVREDLERMLAQHRQRRQDAKSALKKYEFRFMDKNGAVKDIVLSIDMIPGTKKSIASLLDITERKQSEEKLQRTLESLRKAVGTTIQVMVSAVEMRDPYTAGHQIRSANLAMAIAREMDLDQNKIDGIHMAGSIHDIGKLSIPSEILSKPNNLTQLEFSLIKEHPRSGYEMLKDVEAPWPLAEIIYQHHELINGTGYPRHLKGDDILIEARILAVADIVEAMASHRPYRASLGIEAALEEIEKNKGILYDAVVVDACLKLFREKGYKLA
ncbi:MAG TPA: PAS domain S-box protein [Smithella sp.]|nr:PAS domain S-box protein [Smithella sp.]